MFAIWSRFFCEQIANSLLLIGLPSFRPLPVAGAQTLQFTGALKSTPIDFCVVLKRPVDAVDAKRPHYKLEPSVGPERSDVCDDAVVVALSRKHRRALRKPSVLSNPARSSDARRRRRSESLSIAVVDADASFASQAGRHCDYYPKVVGHRPPSIRHPPSAIFFGGATNTRMFHNHFRGKKREREGAITDDSLSAPQQGMGRQQERRDRTKPQKQREHTPSKTTSKGRNHDDTRPKPKSPQENSKRNDPSFNSSSNTRKGRSGGGPPTEAALALSEQLKGLSREKKLDEALRLYRDSSHDNIRDGYHACIMIDMAARCGRISVR